MDPFIASYGGWDGVGARSRPPHTDLGKRRMLTVLRRTTSSKKEEAGMKCSSKMALDTSMKDPSSVTAMCRYVHGWGMD